MNRPNKDQYFLNITQVVSDRGTCCRRKVGCVLVDRLGHILSTGYNGTAAGLQNCSVENPCNEKAKDSKSGFNLESCQAIHAEQNALLQCPDVTKIQTAYTTHSPCVTCVKLLLNTSCQNIVFKELYPHNESKVLWESAGRVWEKLND